MANKRNRPPKGAIFALIVSAVGFLLMRADPKGTGADPVVKSTSRAIGTGGAIWLAWAALRRAFSRRA